MYSEIETDYTSSDNDHFMDPIGVMEATNDAQQNRKEREKYAHKSYYLVLRYLFAVLLIIFLVGIKVISLSDSILLTLLGTSLLQIIGLFKYVMKYLFPSEKKI